MFVSIIIPTFNGAGRIGHCLDALLPQTSGRDVEILVIDDGSTDPLAEIVSGYGRAGVRLITQKNAGPAAARNRGAAEARGSIILFTDDDCVPMPGWLDAMTRPFEDAAVVSVKGVYRTRQKSLLARFVQIEYEDRYRKMDALPHIDFIDTYSAGFRRANFLEMDGYDTSFPVACAEDAELSYRMSARGGKMLFVPGAMVYHTHPDSLARYLRKKYKFAFWRVLAVRKNPSKAVKDSHTPQLMKLQLLFWPGLLLAASSDLPVRRGIPATALVVGGFLITTIPFALRAMAKDFVLGLLSPLLLAARSGSQMLGVTAGTIHALFDSVRPRSLPL
jgi:glycosyltransferase involved in cell wall biosynthesis